MKEKILIVEDQFVEADYLRLMLVQAGYRVTGIARSVAQAQEMIQKERPEFVLLDIFLKGKQTGIDLARQLGEENLPFVYLSANSNEAILHAAKATQPYGFLVKPFREKDLLVTLEIAKYRHEHSLEARWRKEAELQKALANIVNDPSAWDQKLLKIATMLQPHIPFDFLAAGFDQPDRSGFNGRCFLRIGLNEYQVIGLPELQTITGKTKEELIGLPSSSATETNAAYYNGDAFQTICRSPSLQKLFADCFQLKSHLKMPLSGLNRLPFSFCLYSRRPDAYTAEQVELFQRIQWPLANSIGGMLQNDNEEALVSRKPAGSRTGNGMGRTGNSTGKQGDASGIIGKSHLLLNALDLASQVAPMSTSVLLLGESGTGKEKIADYIHQLSTRRNKAFVKVNCAALPATLIESELFGHEKGAFTGAHEKRVGRFEKADGGTIFLDEMGEMPIELQVKLLRVLQEKEIERIGGADTIKTDVRVIAATNKNLEKEVAEGRFRLDLYYRLNVFPILLPALRERREDIPALAYHFMHYYNYKSGKKMSGFSDEVLKRMMAYDWPGNIRELENLIERSVLLAKGTIIEHIPLTITAKTPETSGAEALRMKTIQENERDYILSVLKRSNGRIWGAGGAAEILNIPPSTLKSKMKKLGITKGYIHQ